MGVNLHETYDSQLILSRPYVGYNLALVVSSALKVIDNPIELLNYGKFNPVVGIPDQLSNPQASRTKAPTTQSFAKCVGIPPSSCGL